MVDAVHAAQPMTSNAYPESADSPLFEPVGKVRLFERVLDQLERIREGRLKAGDKLPSERMLSSTLAVSRQSLREALRVLEAMGIISVCTEVGDAAGSVVSDRLGQTISRLMRLHLASGHFDIGDMLSMRELLEESALQTGARQRSKEQLEELREAVVELNAATDDPDKFLELNGRFHVMMAAIAENMLSVHMLAAMRDAIAEHLKSEVANLDWPTHVALLQKDHQRLLEAFEHRDPDDASQALRHHTTFNAAIRLSPSALPPRSRDAT